MTIRTSRVTTIMRERVCVCVCVCVRERVRVCVCERERERVRDHIPHCLSHEDTTVL